MNITHQGKNRPLRLRGECPICRTRFTLNPNEKADLDRINFDKDGVRVMICPTNNCGYPVVVEIARTLDPITNL